MIDPFVQSIVERIAAGRDFSTIENEALSLGYTKEQVALAYNEAQSKVLHQSRSSRTILITVGLLLIGLVIVAWPIIVVTGYLILFVVANSLGFDMKMH